MQYDTRECMPLPSEITITDLQSMLEINRASLQAASQLAKRITALEAGYKELAEVVQSLVSSQREFFESYKLFINSQKTVNVAFQKSVAALVEKVKDLPA